MRTKTGLWIGFLLVTLASIVAYKTAWSISGFWVLLIGLAAIAVVLSFLILRHTGLKLWSLVAVVGGLIIGQWGLIQWLLIVAFGKTMGFAP